eukprot:7385140-Prymnesium_polylepis.1
MTRGASPTPTEQDPCANSTSGNQPQIDAPIFNVNGESHALRCEHGSVLPQLELAVAPHRRLHRTSPIPFPASTANAL